MNKLSEQMYKIKKLTCYEHLMLTVHSSGGNTGKSKTRVKFYPAHGLLFSDV